MRIEIDEMFMSICDIVARRSHCLKGKVGAVLVRDGRIISIGFNGMVSGTKNCVTINDCPRDGIPSGTRYEVGDCAHAEHNAIVFCAKHGVKTDGATLYVNSSPCRMCAKTIIQAGIIKVIYSSTQYDGTDLLKKAGIECIEYKQEVK